jgi:hypothetical protein
MPVASRWEYVVRHLAVDSVNLTAALCLMGDDGWELVAAQPLLYSPGGRLAVFVFKRERLGQA